MNTNIIQVFIPIFRKCDQEAHSFGVVSHKPKMPRSDDLSSGHTDSSLAETGQLPGTGAFALKLHTRG